MRRKILALAPATAAVASPALAADVPNMVGTWDISGETAGARAGKSQHGYAKGRGLELNNGARNIVIVEKQEGRAFGGKIIHPDGKADAWVGVIPADGKSLIGSTLRGTIDGRLLPDGFELCWVDNLNDLAAVSCDIYKCRAG